MRILIIGEGGRESALAAKLQNDPEFLKCFLPTECYYRCNREKCSFIRNQRT
jgi:phosphoribosylamine-glycine ligase